MSISHKDGQRLMQSARNRAAGKPLANNTRMFDHTDGSFGIVFHNTEIVTIHPNGTYTLRNGGWNSPTTIERIRSYAPVTWQRLISEKGDWFVRLRPRAKDPRPTRVERSIPKPFTPGDWMDEPIKAAEGCKGGQIETTEHVNKLVKLWRKDLKDTDTLCPGHEAEGDPYEYVDVLRSWTSHTFYSEARYWSEEWAKLAGDGHKTSYVNEAGEKVTKVQCPHCAEFEAQHSVWFRWYYGDQHATLDQRGGFKLYREMMDRFHNDKDLWQEGYIADFRARRAYLAADREWDQRNRVPFFDGIVIDSDGYAERLRQEGPSPAKLRRHERQVEKIKKDIDKFINGYMKALAEGMPMPSEGDCWYCLMFDAVPSNGEHAADQRGKSIEPGNTGDNNHLFGHIKERYYVPSLVINALRDRGRKDLGIAMILMMDTDNKTMGGPRAMTDMVRRDLRRYLRNRMVPTAPTE
jgi:hypothetical protein